jgi:hypothetical protein
VDNTTRAIPEKIDDVLMKEVSNTNYDDVNLSKNTSPRKLSESPEIFITDDNLIHIQESQTHEAEAPIEDEVLPVLKELDGEATPADGVGL